MPDFDDIRRGLAANLRTVLAEDDGHVDAYFRDSPPVPCLQVAGVTEMTKTDFGDGRHYLFVVEGCFGLVSEVVAQKLLDRLIDEVADAGEADNMPAGSLFSRLQDDGTILTNQAAAADCVAFTRYLGQGKTTPDGDSVKILVASWEFQVIT